MIRTTVCVFLGLFMAGLAHGQITASLNDSGFIVISGNSVPLLGLDFESPAGLLVPIPGDVPDPDPFGFLLENLPTQVTFGSLTTAVLIDGDVTLGVGYTGDIDGDDLIGMWGGPEFDGAISFPTAPSEPETPANGGGTDPEPPTVTPPVTPNPPVTPDPPVSNPVVPEPSAGLMLMLGVLAAGAIRSSRLAD